MLRNLIYSFCFHVLFVALLFISTFEFTEKITLNKVNLLTIGFVNENTIDDLEKIEAKKEDERVKDLKLEEKIEIYYSNIYSLFLYIFFERNSRTSRN